MPGPTPSIFCKRCGYCLRGLVRGPCPECGQPFDPQDPSTFDRYPWRFPWDAVTAAVLSVATVVMTEVYDGVGRVYRSHGYPGRARNTWGTIVDPHELSDDLMCLLLLGPLFVAAFGACVVAMRNAAHAWHQRSFAALAFTVLLGYPRSWQLMGKLLSAPIDGIGLI